MKDAIVKIICVFLGMCFLLPVSILTTDDVQADSGTKSYVNCWREAESFDWSWETDTGLEWKIKYVLLGSDNHVAEQNVEDVLGDSLQWDFTVTETGTYYFWVRGHRQINGSDTVNFYWNDALISTEDFKSLSSWKWFKLDDNCSSGVYLTEGTIGSLKLQTGNTGLAPVDNILITSDPTIDLSYYPYYKGVGGCINHTIGEPLIMNPGFELADIDEEYIEDNTWDLSDINDQVLWENYYDIPMGRFFGTRGEHLAAEYLEDWFDELGMHVYMEPIAAYPDTHIDDLVEVHSKGFKYKLDDNLPEKTATEFFIGPRYNATYFEWGLFHQYPSNSIIENLSYNCSYTDLELVDRSYGFHDFAEAWWDYFQDFFEDYKDSIESDLEDYVASSREDDTYNDTLWYLDNLIAEYFEADQERNFSFENFDPYDNDTWPDILGEEYEPGCLDYDYVYIEEDPWNNPNIDLLSLFPMPGLIAERFKFYFYNCMTWFIYQFSKNDKDRCKGLILYDFNEDCHDMINTRMMSLPMIFINGSVGESIMESLDNNDHPTVTEYWIDQYYNDSVRSYNVIGTIYGEDPSKTVIVDSLYDCWWNNGTTDSAIGMSIVTGIAKYFKDNNIIPKYTLKFIGFSGEESGYIGAWSYERRHKDENIIAFIDLNQLGFRERTDISLEFNVTMNRHEYNSFADEILDRSDYYSRGDPNASYYYTYKTFGQRSNDHKFAARTNCQTICLLKDHGWTLHHRAGQNYLEGDVFKYYEPDYVRVCAEMTLNLTLAFACPNLPVLVSPANHSKFLIDNEDRVDVVLTAVTADEDNDDVTYRFYNADTDEVLFTNYSVDSGEPATCTWETLCCGNYSWYVRAGPSVNELGPSSVVRTFVVTNGGGDMNDDGNIGSGDVRYLALFLAGDPLYRPLYADGDVNNDTRVNSGDVRYLSKYLAGDPEYRPLYPPRQTVLSSFGDAWLNISDIEMFVGGNATAFLSVSNAYEIVGSYSVNISYDPSVISMVSVTNSSFNSLHFYDDETNGVLHLLGYNTTGGLTGDFCVCEILFEAVSNSSDSCNLLIETSELLTNETFPADIIHNTTNGTATVYPLPNPVLAFAPESYDFGEMEQGQTGNCTFDIWNNDTGTLWYVLNETSAWVTVSPLSGNSTGENDTITVEVNTTGLSSGTYNCNISISSNGGNDTFMVEVVCLEEILDVNQSVFDRGFPIHHALDGDWSGAQNFTPSVDTITRVAIYMRKFGTPEFNLTVDLRENSTVGNLLDSICFLPGDISASWDWVDVDFDNVAVSGATDYFIVCQPPTGNITTSFGYEWGYAFGDQYGDGSYWFTRDGGGLWRDLPDSYEFTFRTYGFI